MLKVLDLFSGIGGFSLGLERTGGFETVAFCEIDRECREQLKKNFPGVPSHDDIHTLRGDRYAADVICGGFPCQPYSRCGKQDGNDHRLLWPEMLRVIREARDAGRAHWVIGENVDGIGDMGAIEGILVDLESLGYEARAINIPAGACPGADHLRHRYWIVANHNSERTQRGGPQALPWEQALQRYENDRGFSDERRRPSIFKPGRRAGTNGVPATLARLTKRQKWQLKCLGNAVHPYIPEMIGRAILASHKTDSEAL